LLSDDNSIVSMASLSLPNDPLFGSLFGKAFEKEQYTLVNDGVGGTYFMNDEHGDCFGVFKPADEEPGMKDNPKNNHVPAKKGILPGEGYLREIAAYLLDHENRAKVPFTQIVETKMSDNIKKGSLQKFVKNIGTLTDMSSSKFSVSNVHNIAQLDIRLMNMDRNSENFLVTETDDELELIPIDHTYSLPSTLSEAWFDWMYWKQAKEPFSESMIQYIEKIDIEQDSEILRSLKIREECINVMKLSTLVLKRAASVGWSPYKIATFLCRPLKGEDKRSPLEKLVDIAKEKEDYWNSIVALINENINLL
jgi:ribosome biogenesis protein Nip4